MFNRSNESVQTIATNVLLFVAPATCLTSFSKYGYTLVPLILALSGVYFFIIERFSSKRNYTLDIPWIQLRRLSWGVWVFAFISLVIDSAWGIHLGAYEAFLPFLLYPFMIWFFKSKPVLLNRAGKWLWLGAATGAAVGLGFSVYQHAVVGVDRASMHGSAISSGNTGVVLAAASAIAYLYAGTIFKRSEKWVLLVGALSGIATSFLSGSKGGWLSIVMMAIVFWPQFTHKMSLTTKAVTLAVVFFTSLVVFFHPGSPVNQRLTSAVHGLVHWVKTGVDDDGSVGSRLSMWRFGMSVAHEKPLFGFGTQGLENRWSEEIQAGRADPNWGPKGHLHNEMLTIYLMRGALGLVVALAVYVVAFKYFWRYRKSADPIIKAASMMGIFLVALYLEFGLSDTIWFLNANRQIFLFWYFVLAGLIFAQVRQQEKSKFT